MEFKALLIKNGAFFCTLKESLSDVIDIYEGIAYLYRKEQLYQLYLAQIPVLLLDGQFMTFEEYLNKCTIKEEKDQIEIITNSIDILKSLQTGGEK